MHLQENKIDFKNWTHQIFRSPAWLLLLGCAAVVAGGGGGAMPWDAPTAQFVNSITGPWAGLVALLAIVMSAIMLIFGGDLNRFMTAMLFVILGVAVIVGAAAILQMFGVTGAVLPVAGVA